MSKKKTRSIEASAPAAAVAPASVKKAAPVSSGLLEFLKRRSLAVAIVMIALGTLRIVATYPEMSITWDEPGHMGCGMQYLADHVYKYESQHPPLARAASAFLPFVYGVRPGHDPYQDREGIGIMVKTGHPGTILTLMRLGILPFFILAAIVVYLWAKRHFDPAVAAIAAGLFTLVPTVLAHGGVATTDMPLTACLGAAFFALMLWAEEPTWRHSLLLGFTTALAVTSKFTAFGYFPAAAVFALLGYLAIERPGTQALIEAVKVRALPFGVAVFTGAFVIWAIYLFSFGKPPGWNFPVPAPELFDGISVAMVHNKGGHAAYLLGEIRNKGWWYFFPVSLFFKTPIGWLVLAIGGIVVCCYLKRDQVRYWIPVAFTLGVMVPAMTSHVNIGLRHVLPVFVSLAILAAIGLVWLMQHAAWSRVLGLALVAWVAISGLSSHPDYIGYFNEFAGDHPERIELDSDLDWGQNAIRLARRMKEVGATTVGYQEFNFTPALLAFWPGLPNPHAINPYVPDDGWNAISPTRWMLRRYGISDDRLPWFPKYRPVEKVGSLWLYYCKGGRCDVPPGS